MKTLIPLPFSNRGYNKAPAWLWQEPIDISDYTGEQLRLRFTFDTVDELYNGFRGWLVDEVRILNQAGTFPRWTGGEGFGDLQFSEVSPDSELPLVLGEDYTFSATVNYVGEGDAATLTLSYITLEDFLNGEASTLLVELDTGVESGTLSSELTTIDDSVFVIVLEAVDSDGEVLTSESINYVAY
ncbi:hypothetical protein [Saccharospirillum impatiens]|uniref:hypothetical protein n=1 Tax=Saccharospirillum impatiens TaxID=169438 RepID=UPI00042A8B21|nr:hypothetical protein [Saccharospirillum impatiens]